MNKWGKALFILIFLFFLFFPLVIATKYIALTQLYDHFVTTFSNLTGINQYLINAGVVLMLVPLYFGIRMFFSFKRHLIGIFLLAAFLIVYNLGLYQLTKDVQFSFSEGKTLKWYALTPEGVKFYDRAGVDPDYGIPLKPVTPEVIHNLKLIKKGEFNPVDPEKVTWFNPITGDPQVWYYQYPDGRFEFFNKPGFHPITGDPLKPVNKQIHFEWLKKSESEDGRKIGHMAGLTPDKAGTQVADEKTRRISELKSLINRNVRISSDKTNVVMVLEIDQSQGNISTEGLLNNLIKKDKFNIINNYLMDGFKTKGYFKEVFSGNTDILMQAGAFSKIDYLFLGRITYSYKKSSQIDSDLISCHLSLNYKIINKHFNIIASETLNVVGPGFSEEAAVERAVEIMTEKYSDRITKAILG